MLGKKVRMVPTPLMTPSTTRDVRSDPASMAARPLLTVCENQSMPDSRKPLIQSPTVKVRKKITAMRPRKTGMPHTLLTRILSVRSVNMSWRSL